MQEKKYNIRHITRKHLKLARLIIDMEQTDVVTELGISIATMTNLERADHFIEKARASTIKKLVNFYESKGVVFFTESVDGGDGVKRVRVNKGG